MIARPTLTFVVFAAAVAFVAGLPSPARAAAEPSDADVQFFEAKVRPLLVERCYKCHSHEAGKDKGGLYLDSRAAIVAGGETGPSVVPGDPAKSKLIEAVSYKNVDLQMPREGKLADSQLADLDEWVKRGAPWPSGDKATVAKADRFDLAKRKAEHWAWQPVKAVELPIVKDAGWAATPIDRFILAKLQEKNLTPAGPADKRALIRRANFAVTGLPPTPAEVEAFVADASPDAFAKVVDRLLASPHFGERWGRHWLDVVRYAETRGHEFDYAIPNAWQYRDYVTRALNADVPYDQFVKEHVAGDLLPKPRLSPDGVANESVIATGFWFLNEWVHSPVDIRQDEVERVDNQVDVFAKAFNGLTLGCARCHDHKFDAIRAADYYALAGFMHSSSFRNVAFENVAHNAEVAERLRRYDAESGRRFVAAMDGAAKPVLDLLPAYLTAAGRVVNGQKVDAAREGLNPAVLAAWAAELKQAARDPADPLAPLVAAATNPEAPGEAGIHIVLGWAAANRGDAAIWQTIVDYGSDMPGRWIADGPAFGSGPRAAWEVTAGTSPEQMVAADGPAAVASADANLPGLLRTPTFVVTGPTLSMLVSGTGRAFICIDSHRMVEGPLHNVTKQAIKAGDRWRVQTADLSNYLGQRAHVEFTPGEPGTRLAVRWVKQGTGPAPAATARPDRFLQAPFSPRADYATWAGGFATLLRDSWSSFADARNRDGTTSDAALAQWLLRRPALLGLAGYAATPGGKAAWVDHLAGRKAIFADVRPSANAMAILDGSPFDEHVLIRGSHKTPGDLAPRRYLEAIDGPAPIVAARGSGRLQLADRLVDPANPLTSRVMVNRVWHHLFGRGIVASVDNFGVLGERPTHPELLDYLADGFVKNGWSVKRLIRRVMLTNTWQMSSTAGGDANGKGDEADPQNLLLHRQNLRRLEGESIRDEMLAVSGRLDEALFGPSVEVYLTPFMEGRGGPVASGPLDGANRRSLYTKVRRNFLPPMMLAFDTPQPFNAMGRRSVSNVPAQALILMNDPLVVEQANLWAKRVLAEQGKTPGQRVDAMYRAAFARPPTKEEIGDAIGFLASQGVELGIEEGKRGDDPRVWADLAHVLMNVKEFVYVP